MVPRRCSAFLSAEFLFRWWKTAHILCIFWISSEVKEKHLSHVCITSTQSIGWRKPGQLYDCLSSWLVPFGRLWKNTFLGRTASQRSAAPKTSCITATLCPAERCYVHAETATCQHVSLSELSALFHVCDLCDVIHVFVNIYYVFLFSLISAILYFNKF